MKAISILSLFTVYIFYRYFEFLCPTYLAEDLPGHIELTKRLIEHKQIFFYDRYWFTGWPAFQFYGFLPHLLAALLSFFTKDIELSIRFIMLLASSLIPFSFHFALNINDTNANKANQDNTLNKIFPAIIAGFLSLWFLNVDKAFFGVGISSLFKVGLFSQVFGWHSILIALGLLVRKSRFLSVVIALAFLSHTLSAAFIILISLLWFFINAENRKNISYSIITGLGAISFFLYPYLKYSKEFSNVDDYMVNKDWLNLLFQYPIFELSISRILNNQIELFNLFFIVICFLMLLFWHKVKGDYFRNIIISIFSLTIITSSSYLISSNFLSMHYYRLSGMTLILALVCIALFTIHFGLKNKYTAILCTIFLLLASYNLEPLKIAKATQNTNLTNIANYLKNKDSRVFIEYNTDYKRLQANSGHFLESNLGKTEVTNGLFVESANINRYISFSADKLGGNNFHGYLLFVNGSDIDKEHALKQLKSFGINKIVSSSNKFTKNLNQLTGSAEYSSGAYHIFNLDREIEAGNKKIEEINKPIVGYIDLEDKLPFSYVSQFFYSRKKLFNDFELIHIKQDQEINFKIDYALINGAKENILSYLNKNKSLKANKTKLIPFSKEAKIYIKKNREDYPPDNKVEIYKNIRNFFFSKLKLEQQLVSNENISTTQTSAKLKWANEKLVLDNLKANKPYKINYSYSPLLKSKNLELFRAGQERIIALAKADGNYSIKFSIFNTPYYLLSILLSILTLFLSVFIFYKKSSIYTKK